MQFMTIRIIFVRHEYHERADEPTQDGDALNKANLLPDAVATALGLTGNPQVKDALNKLKTLVDAAQTTANGRAKIATGSYTGTGTSGSSNKNSLTFEFEPKFIVAFTGGDNTNIIPLIMIKPSTRYKVSIFSAHYGGDVMWSANNVFLVVVKKRR